VPYALDLEDYHSGENPETPDGKLRNKMARRIECAVLAGAAFLTAGSNAIAGEYAGQYRVHPITINNVFPLPARAPQLLRREISAPLQLYWFSQTIGPGRGLEEAIEAMGIADVLGTLTLRGRPIPSYMDALRALAAERAPRLRVLQVDPGPPDNMVDLAMGHDVGLALEQPTSLNRELCLTNKAFTYILAGLAVAFTDTRGQHDLAADLGEGAIRYSAGAVAVLAQSLRRWAIDPAALHSAKEASWRAAQRRWHWGHPQEAGELLRLVRDALTHA
jgi:hypothetical protein